MSSDKQTADLGRISIYDINTNNIQLTSSEFQLQTHTGYDEEHLKRLKYLFQQITDSKQMTLDKNHFESAVKSICQSLTESNESHHLAEILFQVYDKNTNDSIDFTEMIDFVWTVIDAPREEQIGSLYQAFQDINGKLSKNRLMEFLILLKDDFQPEISINEKQQTQGQIKSLKTDEDIRNRIDECFDYYHNPSDGLNLNEILDYFLGSKHPLAIRIKTRWIARIERHKKKKTPAKRGRK